MKKAKSTSPIKERRYSSGELRVKEDANGKRILGYATKFAPAMSEDLGGFRERIDPHAFDACLANSPDVRGLWNHDPNHVLGRTTAGTLRLSVDSVGLKYEIDPPDTQLAKDLIISMSRKDVTQSSFGFVCIEDSWDETSNGDIIRTVLQADLFDVSPVTFPAYPDATSGVRASLRSCPANLRAKLKRSDNDDDDDSDDDLDDICNPDSPDYDESADCEDRCSCRCESCRSQRCVACSNPTCEDGSCRECPIQTREAHFQLLLRRLRS
jgi:HK97 family phage prohead protease